MLVGQLRRCAPFIEEALHLNRVFGVLRAQHLDDHFLTHHLVHGAEDRTKTALTNEAFHLVTTSNHCANQLFGKVVGLLDDGRNAVLRTHLFRAGLTAFGTEASGCRGGRHTTGPNGVMGTPKRAP